MRNKIEFLTRLTGIRNVCIGGGVGLNSVANSYIEQNVDVRLFVPPYPSDEGQSLGNAIYAKVVTDRRSWNTRCSRITFSECVFSGPTSSADDLSIDSVGEFFDDREWQVVHSASIAHRVASLIAEGFIVGWFQGRSEYGARALGARSVLADPRNAALKTELNRMKGREEFRPFAPAVLAEFFELPESCLYSFMLGVAHVRPSARAKIPAVTHVDGSARVQLVSRQEAPLFHEAISHFGHLTGVPVLLNTSFNYAGEPIVETVADAAKSAVRIGLDAVAVGSVLCIRWTAARAGRSYYP
jgi:carbamoyltransferase